MTVSEMFNQGEMFWTFRAAWKWQARQGNCDAWGSAECKRLLEIWLEKNQDEAGDPVDFIRKEANRVPQRETFDDAATYPDVIIDDALNVE
jgi:hypothetical protein